MGQSQWHGRVLQHPLIMHVSPQNLPFIFVERPLFRLDDGRRRRSSSGSSIASGERVAMAAVVGGAAISDTTTMRTTSTATRPAFLPLSMQKNRNHPRPSSTEGAARRGPQRGGMRAVALGVGGGEEVLVVGGGGRAAACLEPPAVARRGATGRCGMGRFR